MTLRTATQMRQYLGLLLLAGGSVVAASCSDSTAPAPVATVSVSAPTSIIAVGGTVQLAATLRDASGNVLTGRQITWTSVNNSVAQVSNTGLVTGVAYGGPISIVASSEGMTAGTQVNVVLTFTSIVTGRFHTCGIASNTFTYCWGLNVYGQLGDGTFSQAGLPKLVVTGGVLFTKLVAGAFHTCGLTAAGAAYCWGLNGGGQLGDGTGINRNTAVAVAGGQVFASLAAGGHYLALLGGPDDGHTCGLVAGGAAYCWGNNHSGQLGDGSTTDRIVPTLVSGGRSFTSLTAGLDHTCGLIAGGTAFCWGDNFDGELGDGTTDGRLIPTQVSGAQSFASIDAGGDFTCGLTAAGNPFCWGYNADGQLGIGNTTNAPAPTAQSGTLTFTKLVTGGYFLGGHACGLTAAGAAYCWGLNSSGQLGDNTTIPRSSPVSVVGNHSFASISAEGIAHTCALKADGVAYCWGANGNGQLGDGTLTARQSPTFVRPPGS